jgi:hypothetical protein
MFITSDSPGALAPLVDDGERGADALGQRPARTTPPTSGETTIRLAPSKRSLDVADHHRAGEQIVGRMSKKPWIWPAWRSSVSTRSAPAR